MEINQIGEVVAEAMTRAVEKLNDYQSELRDRWFPLDEDGVRTEKYEKHKISDNFEANFPQIGLEYPSIVVLEKMTIKHDTDLHQESDPKTGVKKLLANFFHGKERHSTLTIEIEIKQHPPAEGLLALHKRAAQEVKEACMSVSPDMYVDQERKVNFKFRTDNPNVSEHSGASHIIHVDSGTEASTDEQPEKAVEDSPESETSN